MNVVFQTFPGRDRKEITVTDATDGETTLGKVLAAVNEVFEPNAYDYHVGGEAVNDAETKVRDGAVILRLNRKANVQAGSN